jgi:hypothetical protein
LGEWGGGRDPSGAPGKSMNRPISLAPSQTSICAACTQKGGVVHRRIVVEVVKILGGKCGRPSAYRFNLEKIERLR